MIVTCLSAMASPSRWLKLAGAAVLSLAPALLAPAPALAAQPSEGELATLCAAHGPGCTCQGCRAFFDACQQPCPSECGPALPPEASYENMDGSPSAPLEGAASPEASAEGPAPMVSDGPSTSLSSMGAIAAASSATPTMIGDFFGAGYNWAQNSQANGATVAVAGGDRLLKFADNNTPIPQDRFYFNYHHFQNAVIDVNGNEQDANRFTFGAERTFWDRWASVEFRMPFTASVDGSQFTGSGDTLGAEFGNMAVALKALIYDRGPWRVGAGLGMIFPTGSDAVLRNLSDSNEEQEAARFSNESYYLQPFMGVYYTPNNRLFTQFMVQTNFDVHGSTVTVNDPTFFAGGGSAGGSDRVYGQSLLFLDYSTGYWIYRAHPSMSHLTGIAPMIELHYATTMQDLDLPNIDGEQIFQADYRRDVLNITGGMLFQMGRLTSLRLAGVAPLRDGTDRIFDSEFNVQLIRRY